MFNIDGSDHVVPDSRFNVGFPWDHRLVEFVLRTAQVQRIDFLAMVQFNSLYAVDHVDTLLFAVRFYHNHLSLWDFDLEVDFRDIWYKF